jgi:hypothetical protein
MKRFQHWPANGRELHCLAVVWRRSYLILKLRGVPHRKFPAWGIKSEAGVNPARARRCDRQDLGLSMPLGVLSSGKAVPDRN